MFDSTFWWTGLAFYMVIACIGLFFILGFIWIWLSISFSLWWAAIRSEKLNGDAFKPEWKRRRFWKLQSFFYNFIRLKEAVRLWGSTISAHGYEADFTGWIPKTRVYKVQKRVFDEPDAFDKAYNY